MSDNRKIYERGILPLVISTIAGIILVAIGIASIIMSHNAPEYIISVCTILNGIAIFVTNLGRDDTKCKDHITASAVADYILEVGNDLNAEFTYKDLCNMLVLAQSIWRGELGFNLYYDSVIKTDNLPVILPVDKLYGDEDIIKTKPLHYDIGWYNEYILINLVMDYRNMLDAKTAIDILNQKIDSFPESYRLNIIDFEEIYKTMYPYLNGVKRGEPCDNN